jgi:rhombotail lipoprotein
MKTKLPRPLLWVSLLLGAAVVTGCFSYGPSKQSRGTSVMRYLYPKNQNHTEEPGVPVLKLPLRVGVAFVPVDAKADTYYVRNGEGDFPEAKKAELLKKVGEGFKGLPYVKGIEIIPSTYLRPAGGFENLEQVKSMFNVDVVVLVAYDQVQFTDEGLLSLSYWTIVGSYVVKGQKNDTQTLMEAVVYDVDSRRLLFRAPGTSRVQARATPVNLSEELRKDSAQGFDEATTQMVANLQTELKAFNERVKQAPEDVKIVHRPGYSGGGSWEAGSALLAAALIALAARRR